MLQLLLCLAFGMSVYYIIYAGMVTFSPRRRYQERLESLLAEDPDSDKDASLDRKQVTRLIIGYISRLFASQSVRERIQQQLLQAGIPLRAEEYISFCLALIFIFPIGIYILSHNFWLAIVAVVIGSLLPGWYVNHQKTLRLQTLNQQLGDALVTMANALRAGFGFQQAMDSVRKELPPPISSEFAWTLREMNLGFSTEESLENLSKRVPSEDLDMVVTGIIIQRQVGGDLAQILDNISSTIRERTRIKREVRVLTAQGRMSGILIGLLPVFLIAALLVINPSYFEILIKDPRGIAMLAIAAGMEITGFLVIRRLTQIDF
ncbi:MAG: type II secretion system F family protein [Syntrophomonadaceae bacterium]|jgi:tight adherence protein B